MRKFVIKNRQKRKYTKKSEEISSFSFSKAAYSMVPLLVMIIAFMSTLIISAPVRNAFTNISFTFTLPQFSLTNPLYFFQTLAADIAQFCILSGTIIQSFAGAISQSFAAAGGKVTDSSFSLINFITLCGTGILTGCLFAFQEVLKMISLSGQSLYVLASQCIAFLRIGFGFTSTFITTAVVSLLEDTSTIAQLIAQQTITIFTLVVHQTVIIFTVTAHFAAIVLGAIINFFVFVGSTALAVISSAATFINTILTRIMVSIVHSIEIPFKIVYAFWLQIKPYVDFFGNHIRMSGSDFSNMVTSMYKVATLMGASK